MINFTGSDDARTIQRNHAGLDYWGFKWIWYSSFRNILCGCKAHGCILIVFYLPVPDWLACHWVKSNVGDFSEHLAIFSSRRFLRPSGSAPIFGPFWTSFWVFGSHHFLITVLHQCDVPLVVVLKLCVVGSGKGEFRKSKDTWMITDLLASSKTRHSLGERSSKEGLGKIWIGLMLLMTDLSSWATFKVESLMVSRSSCTLLTLYNGLPR